MQCLWGKHKGVWQYHRPACLHHDEEEQRNKILCPKVAGGRQQSILFQGVMCKKTSQKITTHTQLPQEHDKEEEQSTKPKEGHCESPRRWPVLGEMNNNETLWNIAVGSSEEGQAVQQGTVTMATFSDRVKSLSVSTDKKTMDWCWHEVTQSFWESAFCSLSVSNLWWQRWLWFDKRVEWSYQITLASLVSMQHPRNVHIEAPTC